MSRSGYLPSGGRVPGPGRQCGVVFGVAGAFQVVAAASSGPDRARRLDGPLRKIATPPLSPWLLVAVALAILQLRSGR
jgi:Domain of Unknown Function (DUF1206)